MFLRIEQLTKSHPSPGGGTPVEILRGIDFSMEAGGSAAIVGPSGAGKSTLLHLVAGLERPDAGAVWVDGKNPAAMGEEELSRYRRQSVGVVFQAHHLLPQCTVLENVLVPFLAEGSAPYRAAREQALRLIHSLGLGHRENHRPAELSGGERQRVAVARALIGSPRLLLADEPTGALDGRTARQLWEVLQHVHHEFRVALLVVTHSRELAAFMQQTWELQDGKLTRLP
jgi:lipoprotein-releasing system ATP-binding protein